MITLSRARTLPDPQPSWRWITHMPDLTLNAKNTANSGGDGFFDKIFNSLLGNDTLGQTIGASVGGIFGAGGYGAQLGGIVDFLTGRLTNAGGGVIAEEMEFPFPTINPSSRFRHGKNNYYPGFQDISTINITFYENIQMSVTRYLLYWQSITRRADDTYGMPDEYKFPIVFQMFNWTKNVPSFEGTLVDCWPIAISPIHVNYNDSNRVVISATFSVDSIKIK